MHLECSKDLNRNYNSKISILGLTEDYLHRKCFEYPNMVIWYFSVDYFCKLLFKDALLKKNGNTKNQVTHLCEGVLATLILQIKLSISLGRVGSEVARLGIKK